MNYWIFQATLERYDLAREIVRGKTATWYATRYRGDMEPGDRVFFWQAGSPDKRGIYGVGRLTSTPYPDADGYGVDVEYEKRVQPALLVGRIQSEPDLCDMLILRAPQSTNFLLSEVEAKAISRLIASSD